MTENTALYFLIKGIAEVAAKGQPFTAYDVCEHIASLTPVEFPPNLGETVADTRLVSIAFAKARSRRRQIIRPLEPYTCRQQPNGAWSPKGPSGTRPQRVWVKA